MKSELIHLLQKLKSQFPDFQGIFISPNGVSSAIRQHGCLRFESLDALESYAWPPPAPAPQLQIVNHQSSIVNEPVPPTTGFLQRPDPETIQPLQP